MSINVVLNIILQKGDDIMLNLKDLLVEVEGKTNEEITKMLEEKLGLSGYTYGRPCKDWYAKTFTYCSDCQLQGLLDDFFDFINWIAKYIPYCFKLEETVYLSSNGACGKQQVIIYYSWSKDSCGCGVA